MKIPGFFHRFNPGILYPGIFHELKSRDFLVPGFFDPGISRDIPGPGYLVDIPSAAYLTERLFIFLCDKFKVSCYIVEHWTKLPIIMDILLSLF